MDTDTTSHTRGELWGTVLLLCILILAGALLIATQPSQAMNSVALATADQASSSLPLNGPYTVTVPLACKEYAEARFTVVKSVTPDRLVSVPAAIVTYTVTIVNVGKEPGEINAVLDTLPEGFTFQSMVAAQSDVDLAPTGTTGTIRWIGPWSMAASQQMRLVYTVRASETPGTYNNQANVEVLVGKAPAGPASATVTILPKILLQEDFNNGIGRWTEFLNYKYRLAPGQWYWGPYDGIGGSGALSHDALRVRGKVAGDALMMYLQDGAQDWTNYRVQTEQYLTGGVTADGQLEPEDGFPIGLWVRGHYRESQVNGQWVTGYYVVVKSSGNPAVHWVRLAQPQIPGDCTTACDNPDTQYAFNNVKVLCDWYQNGCGTAFPGEYQHFQWYTLTVEVRGNNIKAWLNGELAFDYTDDNQPFLTGTIGLKVHETKIASFDNLIVTELP